MLAGMGYIAPEVLTSSGPAEQEGKLCAEESNGRLAITATIA